MSGAAARLLLRLELPAPGVMPPPPTDYDWGPIGEDEFLASATATATARSHEDAVRYEMADILGSTVPTTLYEQVVQQWLPALNGSYTTHGPNHTDLQTDLLYPHYDDADFDLEPNWTRTCEEVYNPLLENNRIEFWVCGVLINIVGLLGILGNVISMIILSRPQMRSSINYLLTGLARCDTVLILTSILLFGIPSIYPYTGHFFGYYNNVYPFISPVVFPIAMIAQTSSIYMTFTVTLERYVAVCHPLRARALCTYGRAKIYFIVCVCFALAYNMPRFWEVLTVTYPLPESDVVLHCVRPSRLRRNQAYINIYIHWCYLIINYIIPFLTLAILNCLIYRQVKRANRERQRLSRSEKREIGLATMLLCVVVVFFMLNFLPLVLNISEAFYNLIDHKLTKLSNLLITINSSVNFLIYIIFGEKFKRIFLLIFFKRRLSRDQPDLIHYESSISNNGDGTINHRSSGRFSRHGTQRSTTTTYLVATGAGGGGGGVGGGGGSTSQLNNVRLTQVSGSPGLVKIKRNRAPSPGPVVYFPAREMQRSVSTNTNSATNNNTAIGYDWTLQDSKKLGHVSSGF
ncbi:FMRFamide receptor [Drosophila miranda]|uniref:FMRFamide receptor n=1 Tax=Drosophila miranda TaxID=7229 RepID=UPI0007E5D000|nr:FMRFamide receptor [Drosophila miranda]